MRKIILGLAVSLDGFIEGPNGEYDWCFTDQDYGLDEFNRSVDSIFMGRKSYDVVVGQPYANAWSHMTTYVFTRTPKESKDKSVVFLSGDWKAEVERIRRSEGKDIWLFGGAELTTHFINAGLCDVIWLSVHPILLGSGKPLFQNITGRKSLKLISHKVYDTGLVSLVYSPG